MMRDGSGDVGRVKCVMCNVRSVCVGCDVYAAPQLAFPHTQMEEVQKLQNGIQKMYMNVPFPH